jgi:hypothetical protein
VVEALSQSYPAPRWLGVLSGVALVAPLPWRRAHPVRVAVACLAAYSAVAHARRVMAGAVAAAWLVVALVAGFVVEPGGALGADLFFLPLLVAGAGGVGLQVRLHRAPRPPGGSGSGW